ncbi:hypothetical protein [Arthrobacter psychrolactophilus]
MSDQKPPDDSTLEDPSPAAADPTFPWRMLFPLPLPLISDDSRSPAQVATVDIKAVRVLGRLMLLNTKKSGHQIGHLNLGGRHERTRKIRVSGSSSRQAECFKAAAGEGE